MRISVCEFLRLSTNTGWCYLRKGVWVSDGWAFEAHRDEADEDVLHIVNRKTGKVKKTLTYWAGSTAQAVREKNRNLIQRSKFK